MDRVERLLSKGYFPSQLPPPFNTKDLAAQYMFFYKTWLALQKIPKKESFVAKAPCE